MSALVRSELLKIRSTRMWWGLLGGALAFVALNVVAQALAPATEGVPALGDPQGVRNVWASAGSAGTVFALVLGILGMTTEYRHRTLSATFLVTPRRSPVVVAKMLAHALAGFGLGLACCALTAALAIPLLAAKDAASISTSTILSVLAGALLATTLYAVMGVAVGALVPNQVAALIGALVWLLAHRGAPRRVPPRRRPLAARRGVERGPAGQQLRGRPAGAVGRSRPADRLRAGLRRHRDADDASARRHVTDGQPRVGQLAEVGLG